MRRRRQWHDATADADVCAVVIAGRGGIFTAGNDLEDFLHQPPNSSAFEANEPPFNFMHALVACDKPVIAAVTGSAIGIGTTMLLHCDFVYLSEGARLLLPFVSLGLVPEFASSLLLPRRVGRAKAASMLLLGDAISAAEAQAYGIATAVLPDAAVLPAAQETAARFRDLAPGAVRASKKLMQRPESREISAAILAEARVFAERLRSPEARAAMRAFLTKRQSSTTRT
jgi:enoyl-CoA hydratase/carnithine racemase